MEQKDEDLRGMDAEAAREYIFHFITTQKLTEKKIGELKAAQAKWRDRAELARSKAMEDLAGEAEAEAERAGTQISALEAEAGELGRKIETMRSRLPGLAARERRIDPDLLQQELLITLGGEGEEGGSPPPGSTGKPPAGLNQTNRAFAEMNAETALESLKRKMGLAGGLAGGSGDTDPGTAP